MTFRIFMTAAVLSGLVPNSFADKLLLIVGAPGEERYEEGFTKAAAAWELLAAEEGVPVERVEKEKESIEPIARIQNYLTEFDPKSPETLWLVYIGHGTHSRVSTKLNLHGPDLDLETLQSLVDPIESPLVFIHGGSASAPFLAGLAKPNRILISATKSGAEQNYARFGEVFAQTLRSPRSDLDMDGQISLLEAFITTSQTVDNSYAESGRLTSEHALLDDNGDGRGIEASSFQGLRPTVKPVAGQTLDGWRARNVAFLPATQTVQLSADQLKLRDELELRLEKLKQQKAELPPDEYYTKLELIFDQLATLYIDTDS